MRAIADCYSITISVVSTLGPDAAHNIIPNSGDIRGELCLGHFDERNRIHYVYDILLMKITEAMSHLNVITFSIRNNLNITKSIIIHLKITFQKTKYPSILINPKMSCVNLQRIRARTSQRQKITRVHFIFLKMKMT